MRRLFHKVVCTAPGTTEFGQGVFRVKCKQNIVTEMPCGVWLANWRRHSDKLMVVDDLLEEGTVYNPEPATEPEPVVEPDPATEPEPVVEPDPATEPEPVVEPDPIPTLISNEQPRISIDNITAPQTSIEIPVAPSPNKRSYNKRK